MTVSALSLVVALLGIALGVGIEVALHEWAERRYGYYDPELVSWTAALSALVVLTALGAFGVLIAARRAVVGALVALGIVAIGVLAVVASNVPGLGDGVAPESWPLAVLVGLSGAYAVAAAVVGARRLRVG